VVIAIKVFNRWTAGLRDGTWYAIDAPNEMAEALNALRSEPPAGWSVEEQRLSEAKRLYPQLETMSVASVSRIEH
jgi:hypothetical protein